MDEPLRADFDAHAPCPACATDNIRVYYADEEERPPARCEVCAQELVLIRVVYADDPMPMRTPARS